MSNNQSIKRARLIKQQRSLAKQPMENAFVKRDGQLNFYFCIYNLDGDFKDGFYFGLLELHHDYPFAAPKLFFYTPNGRYQLNMPICTTFTNYHQQSWTSAWNVRSLIQGTISFMYSDETSYGCKHDNSQLRIKMAKQSLEWNLNNQIFMSQFYQTLTQKLSYLVKLGITIHSQMLKSMIKQQQIKLVEKVSNLEQKQLQKIRPNLINQPVVTASSITMPIMQEQQRIQEPIQLNTLQNYINEPLLNRQFNQKLQQMKRYEELKKKKKTIYKILGGTTLVIAGIGIFIYLS